MTFVKKQHLLWFCYVLCMVVEERFLVAIHHSKGWMDESLVVMRLEKV